MELSAKYKKEHLQEFKKKVNPGVKDIEEAYKNLIEDQEGKILLLIDEAGSLDRQFFKGANNDSFFEILMNQFRTAPYIRTKIAIYPNSYQDILTETRYGDVVKLEEDIFSHEGYKSFRKKSISLITTTLATIMVTFYSEIACPLVTAFYWAKHNPNDIFESTLDLCTL